MGWLSEALGFRKIDRAGLAAATTVLVRARAEADLEDLASRFHAGRGAVKEAMLGAAMAEVRTIDRAAIAGDPLKSLAAFAKAQGLDVGALSRVLDERALQLLGEEVERQYRFEGITPEELSTFASDVGLRPEKVDAAVERFRTSTLDGLLDGVLEDGMLSPSEEQTLNDAMRRLAISDRSLVDQRVAQAKAIWRVFYDELPVVNAPILLQRGEVCHHVIQAEAEEERSRTVRVNYGGPTARIRIMKGVSYTVGSRSISTEREGYMFSFGTGALCATNKRLLWLGVNKSFSMKLDAIVHYETYSDGLRIRKGTGKPLLFTYGHDDRPATLLIARVIEECR